MTDKHLVMKHVFPPIPIRDFDWCAYLADEVEDSSTYGWGRTPEEAAENWKEQRDDE
jgi:hypothetical protein